MRSSISYNTVHFGQLVSTKDPYPTRFSGRVHFFNRKGVLIGNLYEFVPYDVLETHDMGLVWERVYITLNKNKSFPKVRQWTYETLCKIITRLIKWSQKISA